MQRSALPSSEPDTIGAKLRHPEPQQIENTMSPIGLADKKLGLGGVRIQRYKLVNCGGVRGPVA